MLEDITKSRAGMTMRSSSWGVPLVIGILLVAIGIFAIIASGITALASAILFAALLTGSGIAQIINAFSHRKEGRFVLHLLEGVLATVVGVMIFFMPVTGIAAISLLLIGYFLASGLFYTITSVSDRYPNWGWDLAYGIAAIVLGIIGISQWPFTMVWLVGTLVGLEILFRGVALISASLVFRKVKRRVIG